MNSTIILQNISVDQLISQIEIIIEKQLNSKMELLKPKTEIQYLSRRQMAKHFLISLPTLDSLTKQGRIISYKIGDKILYKSNELESVLIKGRFI
jgi:hypothetical protein